MFNELTNEDLMVVDGGSVSAIIIGITIITGIVTSSKIGYELAKDYAYEERSTNNAKYCYEGKCNGNCISKN